MTQLLGERTNILIIDTDPATLDALVALVGQAPDMQPMPVQSATVAAAMAAGREVRVDAIVVGAELAEEPGIAFCARLRRQGLRLPILLALPMPEEAQIVAGLDAGANDVITLPHRPAEMLARLRAHLRSHAWCEDAVLPLGPYQFRPGTRLLHDSATNRRIRLTDKETSVLKHLLRAGGVPVGRRALLREVWGYAPGASTHTVETHIYRLRRKIEPVAGEITLLLNDGGGYRLATGWTRPTTRLRPAIAAMQITAAAD